MSTEELITAITASILLILISIAFIVWLFTYAKDAAKREKQKTELQIKYLKLKIKYYDEILDDALEEEDNATDTETLK